jgi:hypothetical protein
MLPSNFLCVDLLLRFRCLRRNFHSVFLCVCVCLAVLHSKSLLLVPKGDSFSFYCLQAVAKFSGKLSCAESPVVHGNGGQNVNKRPTSEVVKCLDAIHRVD